MAHKAEPIALRMEGAELAKIFDSKFLGELAKNLDGPMAWYIHLRVGKSKTDGGKGVEDLAISLDTKDDRSGVVLAAEKPETLQKLVKAFTAAG